jgi:hypothetical protein
MNLVEKLTVELSYAFQEHLLGPEELRAIHISVRPLKPCFGYLVEKFGMMGFLGSMA